MQETRLTCSLLLDNALPSWVFPNNQNWFSFFRSDSFFFESWLLPLAIQFLRKSCHGDSPRWQSLPVKLFRLHSLSTVEILPIQLLNGTP
jgi:hypothetical protein